MEGYTLSVISLTVGDELKAVWHVLARIYPFKLCIILALFRLYLPDPQSLMLVAKNRNYGKTFSLTDDSKIKSKSNNS